nr:F-box domain-containing protein [Tanacetum cinerariifolium]
MSSVYKYQDPTSRRRFGQPVISDRSRNIGTGSPRFIGFHFVRNILSSGLLSIDQCNYWFIRALNYWYGFPRRHYSGSGVAATRFVPRSVILGQALSGGVTTASDRFGLHDDGVMHTSYVLISFDIVTHIFQAIVIPETRMVVSVKTLYSSKLVGFNNDEEPIIEVDDTSYHMDTTLQVYNLTQEEFQNVDVDADPCSLFDGPIKESLILAMLPEVLVQGKIFDKKGIDHTTYNITFANAMKVPKQAGVFGGCGIWAMPMGIMLAFDMMYHLF